MLPRTLALLIAVGCGSPSGSGGGAPDGGRGSSGSDAAVPLGDRYLLYYEAGGFTDPTTTPACDTPSAFGSWTGLLAPTPLDVSATWPGDLTPYHVIAFGYLGSAPGSQGLAPAQHDALARWLSGGGTALFITDISFDADLANANTVLNALMQSLGVGVSVDGVDDDPYYYSLPLDPAQPLGDGVAPLSCGTVSYAAVTPPAVVVDQTPPAAGKGVLATQAVGAGRVVVLSDSTCVSDYDYATGTPPLYADCATAASAGASLGMFLRRLGG